MKFEGGRRSTTTRQLGTQSLYVLLGNVFTLTVGFPLQVYVARILGAEGLGAFGLMEAAIATATGVLGLGIAPTVVRFIPAYLERRSFGSIRAMLQRGAVLLSCVGILSYLAVISGLPRVFAWWPELEPYRAAVILMGLMIPIGLILFFLQQALRGFHDIWYLIVGSSFLQLAVKALATLLVFALGYRLQGYVFAVVLSSAAALVWMGAGLLHKLRSIPSERRDFSSALEWRRFAGLSYSTALIAAATASADRYLLGFFAGSASVGMLVVVKQLQQMPLMFNQMLLMVGAPMFSAAHGRDDASERQHLYCLMTDWVVRASLPLVVFLLVFARPLLTLYGPAFGANGVVALRILVAAQAFNLVCGPIGNVALMSGLERESFRVVTLSTLFSTGLMVALAPFLELDGIAIASAAGILAVNAGMFILVRRRLMLSWWDDRFRSWLAPGGVAVLIALAVDFGGFSMGAVELSAVLVAMYGASIAANVLQGLNQDDLDLLAHIRQRLFGRSLPS